MYDVEVIATPLLDSPDLRSARKLLENHKLIPRAPGIYAWYFDTIPPGVPTGDCHTHGDLTLLYAGISPSKPTDSPTPTQTLRGRIRTHLKSNAYGSTLRLSLGVLLADKLDVELRRVGSSGKRLAFARGEHRLTAWMSEHAYVAWTAHDQPWTVEQQILQTLSLPPNLQDNDHHPFHPTRKRLRADARAAARNPPVTG